MRRKRQDVVFYAFDILWLDGQDLGGLRLMERKRILGRTIHSHDRILPPPWTPLESALYPHRAALYARSPKR
jgi:ATP-dependent DNA ligase